jgi:hypothetical protein
MLLTEQEAASRQVAREKLRYRNQFIMGPVHHEGLTGWKRYKVNEFLCLTAHPDLNVVQMERNGQSITLIGFILDPEHPHADNEDIFDSISQKIAHGSEPYESTYDYGGRWILIVGNNEQTILFNDAAGLRQVFYTNDKVSDSLWCASQPGILAEWFDLKVSEEAAEFIDSYEFRKNHEFRFPGYSTPFKEVQHLLPNHLLNLETRTCHRYWPDGPLEDLSPETAANAIGRTLCNLMRSASTRFELALSLTAGLDSRIVMAASKDVIGELSIMTVRQFDKPDDYMDVSLPAQLLSRLKLKHHVIKSSLIMDRDFLGIFFANTALAHPVYAPDAHAIMKYYGHGRVAVTGSASEIGRSSFKKQIQKSMDAEITPRDLAKLQKMGPNPLVIESYAQWLSGLGNLYNVHPLDLFEWEQGHGNWLAMCQLEFDIAWQDIFTPYNCRNLLKTMLSVKDEYRESPDYSLHRMVISNLWPELLEVPINPQPVQRKSLVDTIKSQIPYSIRQNLKQLLRRN